MAAEARWVDVAPERFAGWVVRFGERHGGPPTIEISAGVAVLTGPDTARAECHLPPGAPPVDGSAAGGSGVDGLVGSARAAGRIGLLLARKGAVAVGLVDGVELTASKIDSRYVQGRTAAGGWSQQRFARRREQQANAAAGQAADIVARLLLPAVGELTAVVTGGDRRAVGTVLDDRRLAGLRPLVAARFLTVAEPRLAVLQAAVAAARAIRIRITEPAT